MFPSFVQRGMSPAEPQAASPEQGEERPARQRAGGSFLPPITCLTSQRTAYNILCRWDSIPTRLGMIGIEPGHPTSVDCLKSYVPLSRYKRDWLPLTQPKHILSSLRAAACNIEPTHSKSACPSTPLQRNYDYFFVAPSSA